MLCHPVHGPVQQARPKGATKSCRVLLSTHHGVHTAANSSTTILLRQQLDHRVTSTTSGLVLHAAKDGLDAELEATQKTLDKVLQAVQAAQAAQAAQQQPGGTANVVNQSALVNREQQLWDRQQELMDRMQQQWDQERQAFFAREQQLLSELSQLRKELSTLLLHQATAVTAVTAPAAVAAQPSVPSSNPSAAAAPPAAVPAAAVPAAARAAPADASSAASRPGQSMSPGQATISGPSTASAAVAAAIRAVRDEGVTPTDSTDQQSTEGSWRDLFSSSGDRAVSSVASAIAAVDGGDVLSDLDLTYSSSSRTRGRRRLSDTSSSNGSSSSSDGEAEAAPSTGSSSSASSGVGAVEVQKGDPEGPPPVLSAGDDDIYWVAKLHDGLLTAGYYPSDEELENWLFSDGTLTALLTFQACNSLPETGVTCEETWRQLMGPDAYEAAYGHLSRQGSSSGSNGSSNGGSVVFDSATAAAVDAVETANGEVTYSFTASSSSSSSSSSMSAVTSSSSSSGVQGGAGGWPVVMDMDGGREVHALQVCLCKAGFNCGDDEMRWWQFGSATLDALKTFQACSGLPESGVCDERTWLALLGPDATPEDLDEVRGDESIYDEDMSAPHEGAVWLLGEQRWSSPSA